MSTLASPPAPSVVSARGSRQYEDERMEEESSLLLALPLLPIASPAQPAALSFEAARERAEAEEDAETAQAAAFLLSPIRSPKRKRHSTAPKDEPQPSSRPTRSSSTAGRSARSQRRSSVDHFTDLDRLFSGELLLDDDDDGDDVYEPTTPRSSSSLPNNDAIAARTRARNPVDLSWDELEQQSAPVLDNAEAELDTRTKRKRKRTDLLLPADEEGDEEGGGEVSSELSLMDAGGGLAGAAEYDDPFQRFVFSMNNDAPLSEDVSEDDEEFIPPPADEFDMDEYRDDRSTRVSRRELRELQGDAQLMQQDEEPAVEIDPVTLEIVDVSKRKRHRQRGRSTERSLFSPPSPAIYHPHAESPSPSSDPPSSSAESSSILYNTIHPQPLSSSSLSYASSPLSLLPSPFVLPKMEAGDGVAPPAVSAAASSVPTAAASSSGLLSADQLQDLRHQFNDHIQLLIQSRCLALWWPEQNDDIHSITANIAIMMDELTAASDEHSPSNVPMLDMWRAIAAEEEHSSAPIVQPTNKSLRDERRADMPLLDEWYGIVAQPRSVVLQSTLHTTLLSCDWNPMLRLVLHLRRAPVFTRSEDKLLTLAFLPGGLCHSPAGLPVYPDWAKLQQLLPAQQECGGDTEAVPQRSLEGGRRAASTEARQAACGSERRQARLGR